MKPISQVHFRVVDKGLFLPIALRLAREAKQVSYWTQDERDFRTVRDEIGDGFPQIQRVKSIFSDKRSVDCYVFPDIGFAEEQKELISQGFPVWGARDADSLEELRGKFLDTLANETRLPVPKHTRIQGMTKLKAFLKEREDKWIKISKHRGDWETFHWRNWELDENHLDRKACAFGPFREKKVFYVFEPIPTEIEDGCDTWNIKGQYPKLIIHGMEAKDRAYLGTFQKYADLPEETRCANEAMGPILKRYDYRSFFSTEVRITKEGKSFFTDPTCRAGSPPHQAMVEMIKNYAEVIWGGANGVLVEPQPAGKFGVQAMVNLKGGRADWNYMALPKGLEQWVKCGNCMFVDGILCFPPDPTAEGNDVGWLVAIGDSIEGALANLKKHVDLLPDGASCEFSALGELVKEINEAEAKGMEFTEQHVPRPEKVMAMV